jgi:exopolysaccharide production protein ExoQ
MWVVCAAGLVVAYVGTLNPRFFVLPPAIFLLCIVLWAAYLRPETVLRLTFLLILIAGTKFRLRDPAASLKMEIDAQIVMELGIYALLALIVFLALVARPQARRGLTALEMVGLAFVLLALISTIWSASPLLTLVRGVQLVLLYAIALVAWRVIGPRQAITALSASLLSYVLICAMLSLIFPAWAQGGMVDGQGFARFSWFGVHPITAATYVGITLVLLISEAIFSPEGWSKQRFRLPLWFYMVPLAAILVAANSRGPLLSLAVTLGMLLPMRYFRPAVAVASIAAALIAFVLFMNFGDSLASLIRRGAYSQSRLSQMVYRGTSGDDVMSMSGRVELWRDMVPLLHQRPLVGHGYQGGRPLLLRLRPWAGTAHNGLGQVLIDLGALGAVLLATIFAGSLIGINLLRNRRDGTAGASWWEAAAMVSLAYILVNSVSSESFAGAPSIEVLTVFAAMATRAQTARASLSPAQQGKFRGASLATSHPGPSSFGNA